MDDQISRQMAIDAMANTLWHYPNKCYRNLNEYEFAKGLAELGLKSVPSAQPEPQWIPCSERLPEESDGTVLVCFPDEFPYNNKEPYINAKHNQRVKTASYSQFNKTWYIGDFCAIGEVRPIAWMPLPEPYKERREDG